MLPSHCPLHLPPVWCCPPAAPSTCRLSGIALQLLRPPARPRPRPRRPAALPLHPERPRLEPARRHDPRGERGRAVRVGRGAEGFVGGGGRLCLSGSTSTSKVAQATGGLRQLRSCCSVPSAAGWFSPTVRPNCLFPILALHWKGKEGPLSQADLLRRISDT